LTDIPENLEPSSFQTIDEFADKQLFSANFVFALIANLLSSFCTQMMNTTLPVYVVSIGGSNAAAGIVSGMLAIVALCFRSIIGWVTDVWKRRPVVLVGTLSYGVASAIYAFSSSIGTLLLGRIVHGFGLSCYSTASNSYVADIAPPKRRAEAIGIFAATNSLGLILGPALGFYIISLMDFHWLFNIATGIALVATLASVFAKEKSGPKKKPHPSWSWRSDLLAVEALPIAWTALCLGMSHGSVVAFIAIFATSRGITNPGLYFTVQAIMLLVSRTFSGRLADKYGRVFVIIPGTIAMALSLALLPLTKDISLLIVSGVLMGLGYGMAQPATMALLVDKVNSDQRGLAIATYFIGFDGGVFLGSVAFGVVVQVWGFGIMWPLAAVCVLLGLFGILGKPLSHVAIQK